MREISLQGADNIRDLGGIPVYGNRKVVPGLLFRGSALSSITESDRATLFGACAIRCVIDLRTGWEREAKPDMLPETVEYLHIPFYDKEKVGAEYTKPAKGTVPIGRDIACEPDHYYRSLANALTVAQMGKGVNAAFDQAMRGRAVFEHCSGGKDRAGIFALLLLSVLGASRETILEDYLATNEARDRGLAHVYERFLRLAQGNEELAHELTYAHRARPENLDAFYEAIDQRYGSMDAFMENQLGITDARRDEIREHCTA